MLFWYTTIDMGILQKENKDPCGKSPENPWEWYDLDDLILNRGY